MTPQERKEKHYGFMKIAARQLIDHRNTGYSLEDIARDCGNFANAALAAFEARWEEDKSSKE